MNQRINGNLLKVSANGIRIKLCWQDFILNLFQRISMSNKTRNILKIIAIVLVVVAILMHIHWLVVPAIPVYRFWFVVTGFVLLLISSK